MILQYIDWDPSLGIDLGFFMIRYYSLMWVLAFLLGFQMVRIIFRQENIDEKYLDPMFMYTFFGIVLGARFGELFYDPSPLWEKPLEVFLPIRQNPEASAFFGLLPGYEFSGFQGLASHGAVIGFLISTPLLKIRVLKDFSLLWIFDRLAMAIPIGGSFIRLGNFINSEIVGKPFDGSWAVKFIQQSHSYGAMVPRHPTQIYEAVLYVGLMGVMAYFYFRTRAKQKPGFMFGLALFGIFGIRFVIEFFKESQGDDEYVANLLDWGLNNGQILSMPLVVLGLFLMLKKK